MLSRSDSSQLALVALVTALLYFPFVNKALNIDADMLVHTSRQMLVHPLDPPLGDFGSLLVLHDHTNMPPSSVFYRNGHPPLLPALLAPVIALAGNREWPLHLALFPAYLLSVVAVWCLLGLFYKGECRLYGTLIWAGCPALLVNSHNVMWDVSITALILGSFVLFLTGIRRNSAALVMWSGIVAGLAAVTKVNALPLFVVCPVYLIASRRFRFLALWLVPASLLPLAWVIHNIIVYRRIQYLSVGWFAFTAGDIRYRVERTVSYFGGALVLPVFWLWLLAARRKLAELAVSLAIGAGWGIVLVLALRKSAWYGISYALFAATGIWLLYRTVLFFRSAKIGTVKSWEPRFIAGFAVLYLGVLVIMPSASMRYILPLVPIGLLPILEEASRLGSRHRTVLLCATMGVGILFSVSLAIGDYLHAESDRRLPQALIAKGITPEKTWYYGRMSYEYYLYRAGFRNLRGDPGEPHAGEWLVHELVPGDYDAPGMVVARFAAVPIDTIEFCRWPVRTAGFSAGFYGDDRLPYVVRFGQPQKQFCAYVMKRR
jgi:hypothetical protein